VNEPLRYRLRQSQIGRRLPKDMARLFRVSHYATNGHLPRAVKIRRYLESTDQPRLQLGSGPNSLTGWLNSDVVHGDVFLNVSRRFPLKDSCLSYVYSEHMIEHIPEDDGLHVLREAHRVLRPGGVVRITTPDLQKLIAIYEDRNPVISRDDYRQFLDELLPGKRHPRACQILNTYMRAWGHRYVYDEDDLAAKLTEVGFSDVVRVEPGESEHELLRGLESHEPPWANAAEAMCLEATRSGSG
jgi:predicted SAM-dependent methyltransferase